MNAVKMNALCRSKPYQYFHVYWGYFIYLFPIWLLFSNEVKVETNISITPNTLENIDKVLSGIRSSFFQHS